MRKWQGRKKKKEGLGKSLVRGFTIKAAVGNLFKVLDTKERKG